MARQETLRPEAAGLLRREDAVAIGIEALHQFEAGLADAPDQVALADRQIAASVTPYRESYLRFGPSIVTPFGRM